MADFAAICDLSLQGQHLSRRVNHSFTKGYLGISSAGESQGHYKNCK